jgi:hypothetical protein
MPIPPGAKPDQDSGGLAGPRWGSSTFPVEVTPSTRNPISEFFVAVPLTRAASTDASSSAHYVQLRMEPILLNTEQSLSNVAVPFLPGGTPWRVRHLRRAGADVLTDAAADQVAYVTAAARRSRVRVAAAACPTVRGTSLGRRVGLDLSERY